MAKLGRGLNSLFNVTDTDYGFTEEIQENEVIEQIPIRELKENPYQPRRHFDEEKIAELAVSIKEHGVLQPIIVKKSELGYYIVAGERRFRACKMLGLETIPAIVRDLDDRVMAEIALLENLQRENLTIVEEAIAYRTLIEKHGLTQQEVADRVGKSRSHVTNVLRLLSLPKEVQAMVEENIIEFGHAKILAGIDHEQLVLELAEKIGEEHLSVRSLEQLLSGENKDEPVKGNPPTKKKKSQDLDVQLKSLQDHLIKSLGTPVKIQDKDKKGGKVIIDYHNYDDLNRILTLLNLLESE